MKIHEFEDKKFPFRYLGIIFFSKINVNLSSMLNKVNEFSKKYEIKIQAFNLDNILSLNHIIVASYHANKAMRNKTNLSKTIDIEFLLYLSCQRQIKLALDKFGVKDGSNNVGVCLFGINSNDFSKVKDNLEDFFETKELLELIPPNKEKLMNIHSILDIFPIEIQSQLDDSDIYKEIDLTEKNIFNKMAILSLEK